MSWRPETLLRLSRRGRDVTSARGALLRSGDVSAGEKELLRSVSLVTHRRDTMYEKGRGAHYLRVGLSALRAIEAATGRECRPGAVLDFACGYGRVLRFLRVRYPDATLTACEIDPIAVSFCAKAFGVSAFRSSTALHSVTVPDRFDLIWCGSLITHLDKRRAAELLKLFERHLADGGKCVFSTHGKVTEEALRDRTLEYGLTGDGVQGVLRGLDRDGYGYADYPGGPGYGISLADRPTLLAMAEEVGLQELSYQPAAWDDHHDVYAFGR